MFYFCSHQILDEILQESVEVPSDRDNTQAEVNCDRSGVDEGHVVCLIEFICHLKVHLYFYISLYVLCITACHSNFFSQMEILLPVIADQRTASKSIQTCIRPRMSSRGILVQDCDMCTYVLNNMCMHVVIGCQVTTATFSIRVQCDLMNSGSVYKPLYSTPDVSDDDVHIEDTDTWSEDHDGGNNLDDKFQSTMDTDVIEEVYEDEYTDGDSDEEDVYLADLE